MLVGLLTVRRQGGTGDGRSRQDGDRGGRQEVLVDEHADVLRESVE
jgi:hypothetical protein